MIISDKCPKVSVVIPVYKVEPYIERCVRTLLGQTLDDLEFIFVDDCTPDNSIAILENLLDNYPDRKPQVRIIHHETNRGLAVARVTGVNAARGEYVIHCDSDDWVETNMYELMYAKAKETDADIVGCDFYDEYGKTSTVNKQDFSLNSKQSIISILRGQGLDSYLWCRLIRKSFYLKNNFAAPEDVSLLEDMAVSIPMHSMSEKVSKVDLPLYHYRRLCGGMTQTISETKILSGLKALKFIRPLCISDDDIIAAYDTCYCRISQALITQIETYDPERWRNLTQHLSKPYFGTLKNRISPWLVRHHLDRINLLLIKAFRQLSKKNLMDKQIIDIIDLAPGNYDATILEAKGDGKTYDFTFEVKSSNDDEHCKELTVNLKASHDSLYPQSYLQYVTSNSEPGLKDVRFKADLPKGYPAVWIFIREKGLKGLKGELTVFEEK